MTASPAGTVVVDASTASAVCPSAVCVTMHVAPAGTAGRVTTRVVPAGVPAASVPEFGEQVRLAGLDKGTLS